MVRGATHELTHYLYDRGPVDKHVALIETFVTSGDRSAAGHRGFAYAVPRGQRARIYLLAGRDTEAIIDVITKLAGIEALPSEGLLFSLD